MSFLFFFLSLLRYLQVLGLLWASDSDSKSSESGSALFLLSRRLPPASDDDEAEEEDDSDELEDDEAFNLVVSPGLRP